MQPLKPTFLELLIDRTPHQRSTALLFLAGLAALAAPGIAAAQTSLVTPQLIGRSDASISISISPRFAYSHQTNMAARRDVLVDAFEGWVRRNPDVKIEVIVQQGDDAVGRTKLVQDATAGRAPDAVMIEQIAYPVFYGLAQPFDPYLTQKEIADFFPGVLQGMKDPKSGEVKFLQFTSYTSGLWYRRDLVSAAPATLEDLRTEAKRLKGEKQFRYGLFALGGTEILQNHLLPHVTAAGGEIFNNGQPVFGESKNKEALVQVLSYWKDVVQSGIAPAQITSASGTGDVTSRVAADEMPFILGGSFFSSGIIGTGKAENWAFAPMPQFAGASRVQFQGGWSWAMFTKDKAKQALVADLLMEVYVGRDGMARWGKAGGYTPTRLSVMEEHTAFVNDRLAKSFAQAVASATALPNNRYVASVDAALTNAFQQVVMGSATPEKAVDEAWATVQGQMR
jgi:multiple sugar transport system substrate-binding protein